MKKKLLHHLPAKVTTLLLACLIAGTGLTACTNQKTELSKTSQTTLPTLAPTQTSSAESAQTETSAAETETPSSEAASAEETKAPEEETKKTEETKGDKKDEKSPKKIDFTYPEGPKPGEEGYKPYIDRLEELDPKFIKAALEYLPKVAAYNGEEKAPVRKWNKADLTLTYKGEASEEDLATLNKAITWVNSLDGLPKIKLVDKDANEANYTFIFAPLAEIKKTIDFPRDDHGFFYIYWDDNMNPAFTTCDVGIADEAKDREERDYLIFKNLVKSMGVLTVCGDYKDSIFQDKSQLVAEPSPLDDLVLEMLYRPEVKIGEPVGKAIYSLYKTYLPNEDIPEEFETTQFDVPADPMPGDPGFVPFADRLDSLDPNFVKAALEYFPTIAGRAEYDDQGEHMVRKWEAESMTVKIEGDPTEDDIAAVKHTIAWLNDIPGVPEIKLVEDEKADTDSKFIFKPFKELQKTLGYDTRDWGIFYVWWGSDSTPTINRSAIGISTDVTDQPARTHLIHEEFIQSFGLMADSFVYPDSIFQQDWTTVPHPNQMDALITEMLYRPEVKVGMSMDEAVKVLKEIYIKK